MIINFYGNQFLKFQVGDTVITTDPFSSESKLKGPKFGADIVLQTTRHEDMAGGDDMTYGNKTPYVIKGPGEYEISGIFIKGYSSNSSYDGLDSEFANTFYVFDMDNIKVLIAGSVVSGNRKITVDTDIDILFVPISGDGRMSAKEAAELINNLEPKLIIPYGFISVEDKCIDAFLKEMGTSDKDVQDKLTIKKKEVDSFKGKILIIKNDK